MQRCRWSTAHGCPDERSKRVKSGPCFACKAMCPLSGLSLFRGKGIFCDLHRGTAWASSSSGTMDVIYFISASSFFFFFPLHTKKVRPLEANGLGRNRTGACSETWGFQSVFSTFCVLLSGGHFGFSPRLRDCGHGGFLLRRRSTLLL